MSAYIEKCFRDFVARYKYILNNAYPTAMHMGITERNLTVNFARSIENQQKDGSIITWYEVPIYNTNSVSMNNHLDAVIIDSSKNMMFLLESKRLKNKKSLIAIAKDIERICEINNIEQLSERFFGSSVCGTGKAYGVILADLWTANCDNAKIYKWNKSIFKHFENDNFISMLKEEIGLNLPQNAISLKCYIDKVDEVNSYSYNLVAIVFEVNNCCG